MDEAGTPFCFTIDTQTLAIKLYCALSRYVATRTHCHFPSQEFFNQQDCLSFHEKSNLPNFIISHLQKIVNLHQLQPIWFFVPVPDFFGTGTRAQPILHSQCVYSMFGSNTNCEIFQESTCRHYFLCSFP